MPHPEMKLPENAFRRALAERAITRFQGIPEDDLDYILSRFEEDEEKLARAG